MMLYCALIGVALAGLGGPAKVANETAQKVATETAQKNTKLQQLAALKKELAEKQQELAHVKEEQAELKGAEAKHAKTNATAAVAAGATETDRLLAGLDQIKKLKGTFAKEDGESVGGEMSYELAHGNDIWGAIDSLVSAAAATKGSKSDSAAQTANLQKAMAAFTSTVGNKLHQIDAKDTVENEEYVLGLLAHHRHNATEQEWILANFTKVPAVQKLMKNHKKSGEYSEEFAEILDAEHPAAKPITSFLQRVM